MHWRPKKNIEIVRPMGPAIGYFKMPVEMVEFLNNSMSSMIKNGKAQDASDALVGKVKEELLFDDAILEYMGANLSKFFSEYSAFTEDEENFGEKPKILANSVLIKRGWFVRQFENEYNPLHFHIGSDFSCVGYLSLPKKIEEEWNTDDIDHYPANGHINFTYGQSSKGINQSIMVRPKIGDFYIFPAPLQHAVYPFKTKGERRSFSMNLSFIKK